MYSIASLIRSYLHMQWPCRHHRRTMATYSSALVLTDRFWEAAARVCALCCQRALSSGCPLPRPWSYFSADVASKQRAFALELFTRVARVHNTCTASYIVHIGVWRVGSDRREPAAASSHDPDNLLRLCYFNGFLRHVAAAFLGFYSLCYLVLGYVGE